MWTPPKNLKATPAKKFIYITAFTVLGVMVQQLLHAVVEIKYIRLLVRDFPTWSLGYSWDTWFAIHAIGSAILFVLGIGIGLWQGFYWWSVLYEHKKRR